MAVDPDEFTFEEGFGRLSPIVVLPDSISLEGPKSVLDQFPDSILLEINEEGIRNDFREEVEVTTSGGALLKRTPEKVEVIFEVVEWVNVNKTIQLVVENVPANMRLNLAEDSVQCLVRVPKNQLEDLDETVGLQVAVLDLKGAKKGDKRLLPKVQGLPVNTRLIQVDSVSIKLY